MLKIFLVDTYWWRIIESLLYIELKSFSFKLRGFENLSAGTLMYAERSTMIHRLSHFPQAIK